MVNKGLLPQKWALLIGINNYPYLERRYQLHGCVNDVELMAKILHQNFGFPADHIVLLRDEQATRDGILQAMFALEERVGQDDIVVMHYSGNGSTVYDREGDKPGGLDETIMPYDSARSPHPNRDISDDEICVWLLRLTQKTSYITLIFDCCYSGTSTRDTFGYKARWVEMDKRPPEELPPSPIPLDTVVVLRGGERLVGISGWLPLSSQCILIAASRNDESSYEYRVSNDGAITIYGALTFSLAQELVIATPGTTYMDVFYRTSANVNAVFPSQHPHMEGPSNREILGVRDVKPSSYIPVLERTRDNMVILGAGVAHGLTPRSQWAIYPAGTDHFSSETSKIGLIQITAARALTSEARILAEVETFAIRPGAVAIEETHFYGEMQLHVDIQVPSDYDAKKQELAKLIEESELLRQVQPDEAADVRVYVVAPRADVQADDSVPQIGAVVSPTWAVIGQDGQLLLPTITALEAWASYQVRDELERIARYRFVLQLNNPNLDSLLSGKVEFVILRKSPDEAWIEAEPNPNSGQIVFDEGDYLAFRIVNHSQIPIYINILDLTLTQTIELVHPPSGFHELLEPGHAREIGTLVGEELALFVPDNFPLASIPGEQVRPEGIETFKLFATTSPTDFSLLILQEGFRGVSQPAGSGTPLWQLLDLALTGYGSRSNRRTRLPTDLDWATVERSILLRRSQ